MLLSKLLVLPESKFLASDQIFDKLLALEDERIKFGAVHSILVKLSSTPYSAIDHEWNDRKNIDHIGNIDYHSGGKFATWTKLRMNAGAYEFSFERSVDFAA